MLQQTQALYSPSELSQVQAKIVLSASMGGRLKLAVTAAPEKGKANKAVIELLADTLHINESSIHIISGESSRDKRLMIEGLTPEDIKSLLNPQS